MLVIYTDIEYENMKFRNENRFLSFHASRENFVITLYRPHKLHSNKSNEDKCSNINSKVFIGNL